MMNQTSPSILIDVLIKIAAGDHSGARECAALACEAYPDLRLPFALLTYMNRTDRGSAADVVYKEPTAFEAFVEGGDNPALYRSTIAAPSGSRHERRKSPRHRMRRWPRDQLHCGEQHSVCSSG